MRTAAPAKINWTLDVLERREDGYHEIRSVMQTIDLCDEVWVEQADELQLEVSGAREATEDDLALKAARLLAASVGRDLPALIRIEKRIPVAAGLGGGSSDAAAVLRALDKLYGLRYSAEQQAEVGAGIGSDVPFFVHGGMALVAGRGERITPLPDAPTAWMVVLVPPIRLTEKTKRMYEALSAGDFTDGSRTEALVERLRQGEAVREYDWHNVFERAAYKLFEGLKKYRDALLAAGAEEAHLAGAGPALFALADSDVAARNLAARIQAPGAEVFVTRTLSAQEATAVTD